MAIAGVQDQVWTLYRELTAYRQQPTLAAKAAINAQFDTLCATITSCEPIHQIIQSFQRNRDELLRVLDYPGLAPAQQS